MTQIGNVEAERAVVGALLADPSLTPKVVLSGVTSEDFGAADMKLLFDAIVSRFYADEAVDSILIADELGSRLRGLYGVEGADLVAKVQSLAIGRERVDAAAHAALVREHARRRRLRALAAMIEAQAEDGELSAEEIAGIASQEAMQIATDASVIEGPQTFAEVGRAFIRELRQVKAAREAGVEMGAYFGIPAFDDHVKGLKGGELMIFAGAPGEGKSGVIWNATLGFAAKQREKPADRRIAALIMSFEMGRYASSTRVGQMIAGLSGAAMREGTLLDDEVRHLIAEWRERQDLPVLFDFSPHLRCSQIQAVVSEAVRQHNVGLVVIDHFRYFDLDKRLANRNDEDDEKVRFLKTLARTLNVAVICLAHTRKQSTDARDPRPKLSDLRGSGQISADSDFVVFLHRPAKYCSEQEQTTQGISPTDAELIYEKNRHAYDGTAEFFFDAAQMKVK